MRNHSMKKNIIYNFFKTFSSIVFPLLIFPYISRVLAPDNIGRIQFGQSIVNYFALIASLGIATYAIRLCSTVRNDREKLGLMASEIFSINVFTTALAYVLMTISLLLFRELHDYRILIAIQSITIIMTTMGTDWVNSAMEDFKYITIRTFIIQILSLIAIFCFVRKPDDYFIYAVVMALSASGTNILNIWYRRRYCKVTFTTHIKWSKHLKPILLLFVMLLAQSIFSNADTTMIGIMRGDYEVGLYSVPVKITNIISQVFASVLIVVLPQLSIGFEENNFEKINILLHKILSLTITIGLPCITGAYVLAEELILVAAGAEYSPAVPALKILMISAFFSLIGGSFFGNMILLPSKKEKEFMIACCITAIANVLFNAIFIPVYGLNAAAGTTVASYFILMLLLIRKVDRRIKINGLTRIFISPILGCLAIILFCKLCIYCFSILWLRIGISITGSIFLYCLILFFMKNETMQELLNLLFHSKEK